MSKLAAALGATGLLTAAIVITACSSSGPECFMASDFSHVLLVQWQQPQNGQAPGSLTYDQPSGSVRDQMLEPSIIVGAASADTNLIRVLDRARFAADRVRVPAGPTSLLSR